MSEWKGKERRKSGMDLDQIKKDINDIHTNVAILINKVDANHKSLRDAIDHNVNLVSKHEKSLYGNSGKGIMERLGTIEEKKNDLKEHALLDKWMFGIVISIQIAILGSIFWHP